MYPMWTDAVPPTAVGVATHSYLNRGNCKLYKYDIEMMRCPDNPNDIIYKQTKQNFSSCVYAFCGTNLYELSCTACNLHV